MKINIIYYCEVMRDVNYVESNKVNVVKANHRNGDWSNKN